MSQTANTGTDEFREEAPSSPLYDTRLPQLSRWRRMQIPVIASMVYGVARLIGPTLDYEVLGQQHADRAYAAGHRCIWAFWHRAIFSILWWGRHRGVVVMNTTNFDGQWTRRVIERLGYGTAQGSSTRGGMRGLATMARRLEEGVDVAFTIDGPRGPRFVAKPGPVMLARRTGMPIMTFHAGAAEGYTFQKSWDLFLLPRMFTRVALMFAPPIWVPPDADQEVMQQKHAEMQASLERCREASESWFRLAPGERERLRAEWNA